MRIHRVKIACGVFAMLGLLGAGWYGKAQQVDANSGDSEISFNEPWVVFRPERGPTRDQISFVSNENGKKTLEFNVTRQGDEILVSPSFPIRDFAKLSFKLWSKQRTMLMVVLEDRDGSGFHSPVPAPENQWIDVTLTPTQFAINDDARVKKPALDPKILQSKIMMFDAGKMLGLPEPNLIKIKDMHVTYETVTTPEGENSVAPSEVKDNRVKPTTNPVVISDSSVRQLHARIQSLRPADLVWHHIPWRTSLTEAVQQAQTADKPIFVWAFLHLPKDERC